MGSEGSIPTQLDGSDQKETEQDGSGQVGSERHVPDQKKSDSTESDEKQSESTETSPKNLDSTGSDQKDSERKELEHGKSEQKDASGAAPVDPQSCECKTAGLEEDAAAAIKDIASRVKQVAVSEMLPRTPHLLFLNLITLEGLTYCVELTQKGYRVASHRQDCMNGDFRQLELHIRYFDTIFQLLDYVSPEYREAFAEELCKKLEKLVE